MRGDVQLRGRDRRARRPSRTANWKKRLSDETSRPVVRGLACLALDLPGEVALQVRGLGFDERPCRGPRASQRGELRHVAAVAVERVAREPVAQPEPVGEAVEQRRVGLAEGGAHRLRSLLHAPAASA